jgi:hypothetical protein
VTSVVKIYNEGVALLCIAFGSIKLYFHYESIWRYYPNYLDYALGLCSIALGILILLDRGWYASPVVIVVSALKLALDYRDPVDLLFCIFLIVVSMGLLRKRLGEIASPIESRSVSQTENG